MSIKTYSIKDIADMTYLPIAKIRTLIKNGVIKAEMNEAICGKRKCKRLEVTEEDLIAFACNNPELAGPMLDMEFVKKHTTPTVANIDNGSENYDDCKIPDTPFIAFNVVEVNPEGEEIAEDTDKTESNQEVCPNDNPINEPKSDKDIMIDDLNQILASLNSALNYIDNEIRTLTNSIESLKYSKEWYIAKISGISSVIDHIAKHC